MLTTNTPVFSCEAAVSTDAWLDVCADNTCSSVRRSFKVPNCSGVAPMSFAPGPVFYRLHGLSGNSAGISASPVIEFFVGKEAAANSTAIASIADVNADGRSDLLVGAPGADTVFEYLGSATGLPATPSAVLAGPSGSQFGTAIAAAGDLDADGFIDVAIGGPAADSVYLYLGSANGLPKTANGTILRASVTSFGEAIVSAGDSNDDGFGDLVVAASNYVDFFNGPGCATGTASCPPNNEEPAAGLVAATDVNGDGITDVIVPTGTTVSVFSGTGSFPAKANIPAPAESIASMGDVNADGFGDFVVGASSSESAYLYLGVHDLNNPGLSAVTLHKSTTGFGASVGGGLDVDGDGQSDFLVGAPSSTEAYLYLGPAQATPSFVQNALSSFGQVLAIPGDVDSSGHVTMALGAPSVGKVLLYTWTGTDFSSPTTLSNGASGFGSALSH
jgi:hypothetical protein